MAALEDSNRPIKLARYFEKQAGGDKPRTLFSFSAGSDIIMHIESTVLKPREVITSVGISNDFLRFIEKTL